MMSVILSDIPGSHDTALYAVLRRLGNRGMTLNDKCQFEVKSLDLLGHVLDQNGLRPSPEFESGIVDAPAPETKEQLKSFLGLAGFCANFVPNFSAKVNAQREVGDVEPYFQTDTADQAYIKSDIANSPDLALFDPNRDVLVTADASAFVIGRVLSQISPDGPEVTVACPSRTLSPAKRNYSVSELEALACVWAIEKWHMYL